MKLIYAESLKDDKIIWDRLKNTNIINWSVEEV